MKFWRKLLSSGQSVCNSIAFGDVIQIQDVDGEVTVIAQEPPPYRIETLSVAAATLSSDHARAQPSRLLLPRYRAVPFTGRKAELAQVTNWLDTNKAMTVRLLHAAGGHGKTRLAQQVAAQAAGGGWTLWRVIHAATPAPNTRMELPAGGRLLVVVDYADRWPVSDLAAFHTHLNDLCQRTGIRVRALLLARSAGSWWPALSAGLDSDHGIEATARVLPPLDNTVDRAQLYRDARQHFAATMDIRGTDNLPLPVTLTDDAFGQILAVHMAALVAVDAYRHGTTPPVAPHALSAYLLIRERTHWHKLYARKMEPIKTAPTVMGRAVFVATLTGALPYSDARSALHAATVAQHDVDTVIDEHHFCYPPQDADTVLEALHPDRLGEDLIALSIPGHPYTDGDDAWTPDPLAKTAATNLLTTQTTPPIWTPTAVTVLVETARRWPHVATEVLYPLIWQRPDLALNAGGATLTRLADLPDINPAVLEAIEALLPEDRHVDFDVAAAAIATTLTRHRIIATADPADHALLHDYHAWRLANAGRWEEGLAAAQEAVTIRRQLAEAKPGVHLPQLATSLTHLSAHLSQMGRRAEALALAEEANHLFRRLAEANPDAYLPDLAGSLSNLGMSLSGLGRLEEALAPADEAVTIHRRLAAANPDAYLPDLSLSLVNLSAFLSKAGHREEALELAEIATQSYRQLAEARPAAYLPNFAASLSNFSADLFEVGRWQEALAPAQEAVTIRRRLAEANPVGCLSDLAKSLSNLGSCLSEVGRRAEALALAEEASQLYRRLAKANPAANLSDLAASLSNLGVFMSGMGRQDEALTPIEEAVTIRRRLAEAEPTAYLASLATSLHNLGTSLSEVGRWEEALTAVREAVTISRQLAETNPAAYLSDLAGSLVNLGLFLSEVGRWNEALAQAQEAVIISRRLGEGNPAAYLPNLAGLLVNLGSYLSEMGRLEDAVPPAEEAAQLYVRLAEADPAAYLSNLALSLNNLRLFLAEVGRREEADQLRRTVGQRLSSAYRARADVLVQLGRTNEATDLRRLSTQIHQTLSVQT